MESNQQKKRSLETDCVINGEKENNVLNKYLTPELVSEKADRNSVLYHYKKNPSRNCQFHCKRPADFDGHEIQIFRVSTPDAEARRKSSNEDRESDYFSVPDTPSVSLQSPYSQTEKEDAIVKCNYWMDNQIMESDDRTSLVNQLETSNNAERPPLGSEHIESTEMEEAEKDEFDREDYEEQLLISNGFNHEVEVCEDIWNFAKPDKPDVVKINALEKRQKMITDTNQEDEICINNVSTVHSKALSSLFIDFRSKYKFNEPLIHRTLPHLISSQETSNNASHNNMEPQNNNQWIVEKVLAKNTIQRREKRKREASESSNDSESNSMNVSGRLRNVRSPILVKETSYLLKWKEWGYFDSSWEDHSPKDVMDSLIDDFEFRMKKLHAIELRISRKDAIASNERTLYNRMRHVPLYPLPINKSKSYPTFISLNIWEDALNYRTSRYGHGRIIVENWADEAGRPEKFKFILENKMTKPAKVALTPLLEKQDVRCECFGNDCLDNKKGCCPDNFGMKCAFNDEGGLLAKFRSDSNWIVECSPDCSCSRSCPNRVVQRGRVIPICIFRTVDRGWSIRTLDNIAKRTFVMEYIGLVMTIDEADELNLDSTYHFLLDGSGDANFIIDAAHMGNEARFVNHSCNPNMVVYPIFIDRRDYRYHRIAFFAKRDIQAGEELTVDYSHVESKKGRSQKKRTECKCGAKNCRKYFYC